jgi:hypothetical protein
LKLKVPFRHSFFNQIWLKFVIMYHNGSPLLCANRWNQIYMWDPCTMLDPKVTSWHSHYKVLTNLAEIYLSCVIWQLATLWQWSQIYLWDPHLESNVRIKIFGSHIIVYCLIFQACIAVYLHSLLWLINATNNTARPQKTPPSISNYMDRWTEEFMHVCPHRQ